MFILLRSRGRRWPVNHEPASETAESRRSPPSGAPHWNLDGRLCGFFVTSFQGRTTVWTAPVNGLRYRFEIPLLRAWARPIFYGLYTHYRLYGL